MAKNSAIARMTPVNHGRIVKVMNISHKKTVGNMKIVILMFRCGNDYEVSKEDADRLEC